jgi:hypothetical protein
MSNEPVAKRQPMKHDDIIRMAREAGWEMGDDLSDGFGVRLERFAALVAAAERAACIDDSNAEARDDGTAQRIVERIRARGEA